MASMRLFGGSDFGRRLSLGAADGTKLMIVERCFACALWAAILGASAGQAAELPAQNKKPTKAEPARKCDIAGNPGVLAANGVCVRLSGYISTQFSGGNLREQYK
jgi:hypothetical protein